MLVIRRASPALALVLGLVLVNLTLVVSSYPCSVRGSASMASMSGMTMRMHASGSSESVHPGPPLLSRHTDNGQQSRPCGLPWAPRGCHSMVPCAPAALVSASGAPTIPVRAQFRVADVTIALLPSDARAPEIPPPRA